VETSLELGQPSSELRDQLALLDDYSPEALERRTVWQLRSDVSGALVV